jgi:hypothetical protein
MEEKAQRRPSFYNPTGAAVCPIDVSIEALLDYCSRVLICSLACAVN